LRERLLFLQQRIASAFVGEEGGVAWSRDHVAGEIEIELLPGEGGIERGAFERKLELGLDLLKVAADFVEGAGAVLEDLDPPREETSRFLSALAGGPGKGALEFAVDLLDSPADG